MTVSEATKAYKAAQAAYERCVEAAAEATRTADAAHAAANAAWHARINAERDLLAAVKEAE